jgi:hypothetical protein
LTKSWVGWSVLHDAGGFVAVTHVTQVGSLRQVCSSVQQDTLRQASQSGLLVVNPQPALPLLLLEEAAWLLLAAWLLDAAWLLLSAALLLSATLEVVVPGAPPLPPLPSPLLALVGVPCAPPPPQPTTRMAMATPRSALPFSICMSRPPTGTLLQWGQRASIALRCEDRRRVQRWRT